MEQDKSELEIGTDTNELFALIETRDVSIEYNSKIWTFVVRDLTWSEKNQIISDSSIMKTKNRSGVTARFDVNRYNQIYLEKAVVSGPIEMNKINFLKLNSEFGDLLISHIVEKGELIEEDEEKNF